jgi:DNA-binding response OmpR family regulator
MDVLIVERDELVGSMLAETLDVAGIPAAVASDDEALKLRPDDPPRLVITGMNRGHYEDLEGLTVVSTMRRKWPLICVIYLAALWPARLRREVLVARDRFLTKPVRSAQIIHTTRELLDSDLWGEPANDAAPRWPV